MFMFENLEVYRKAVFFTKDVYSASLHIKDRAIKDQLCRAALSIPLNIAEGQGRFHCREKLQFYRTSKGSLYECVPLIDICRHLGYIHEAKYKEIMLIMNEVARMMNGLINSMEKEDKNTEH